MRILSKEEKSFWKQLLIKTFSMLGFTYFSIAVTQQQWTIITPSILASGLYFFTELMKYYKLQPDKKVLSKQNKKAYSFIL